MVAKTDQCNLSLALEAQIPSVCQAVVLVPNKAKDGQSINRSCQSLHFYLVACLTIGSCPH